MPASRTLQGRLGSGNHSLTPLQAVRVAQHAYDNVWGLKVSHSWEKSGPQSLTYSQTPGAVRGKLLIRLAEIFERDINELSALEALNNGKTFAICKGFDVPQSAAVLRYYGGWAYVEVFLFP